MKPHRIIEYVNERGEVKQAAVEAKGKGLIEDLTLSTGFNPTKVIVVCSSCFTVGTLDFPTGYKFRDIDALEGFKSVEGVCLRCKKTVPMVAVDPNTESGGTWEHLKLAAQRLKEQTNNPDAELRL